MPGTSAPGRVRESLREAPGTACRWDRGGNGHSAASSRGAARRYLPELASSHPGLHVESISADASLDLMRGEADLSVRFVRPRQDGVVGRKIEAIGWSRYGSDAYLERRGPGITVLPCFILLAADLHHDHREGTVAGDASR